MKKEKCFEITCEATAQVCFRVMAKNKKEAAKLAKEHPLNEMEVEQFFSREDDDYDLTIKEIK